MNTLQIVAVICTAALLSGCGPLMPQPPPQAFIDPPPKPYDGPMDHNDLRHPYYCDYHPSVCTHLFNCHPNDNCVPAYLLAPRKENAL